MQSQQKLKQMHEKSCTSALKSYSPYSKFAVGCCILAANGNMYTGCNVQNVVNSNSLCAEGTAIVKMVEDGCQEIKEIYVVTKLSGENISGPCGLCRQHIKQFSKDDSKLLIHIGSYSKGYEVTCTLAQLFPKSFGPAALNQ